MRNSNSLTDIPGILVGHASDPDALTGCTVILTEAGAVAGVDQRGGAPGTRETDAPAPQPSCPGGSCRCLERRIRALDWILRAA